MKYIANPVEVEAFSIVKIHRPKDRGKDGHPSMGGDNVVVEVEDQKCHVVDKGMLARMTPKIGDYLVIQSDGYEYLNPKDVFERKYHRAD